jgi:hypothetical protein
VRGEKNLEKTLAPSFRTRTVCPSFTTEPEAKAKCKESEGKLRKVVDDCSNEEFSHRLSSVKTEVL